MRLRSLSASSALALLLVVGCSVGSRAVGGDSQLDALLDASVNLPPTSTTADASARDGGVAKSDGAVAPLRPALSDLFAGRARFQRDDEAQKIGFAFPSNLDMAWDQKKLVVVPDDSGGYFTVTRGIVSPPAIGQRFALFRLRSKDGVHFTQDGEAIFPGYASWNLYDAHLTRDPSGGWLMTFECENPGVMGPSLCVSQSSTPLVSSTWSAPAVIISDEISPSRSASAGAALYVGSQLYVKWTVVDEGMQPFTEGTESTSSRAAAVTSLDSLGSATSFGQTILSASPDPFCTSTWDCNHRDVQDWAVEGGYVYASYSGGNYYRCSRQGLDYGANDWSLAIARAMTPLGTWETTAPLVPGPAPGYCSIAYPTLAKLGADWWMYYATSSPDGALAASSRRVKLMWNAESTPAPLPCSAALEAQAASGKQDDAIRAAHCLALATSPTPEALASESAAITAGTSTRRSVLRALVGTPEFDATWHVTTLDHAHYVALIYELLLRRVPTATERATWLSALNGATKTRADFVDDVTASAELGARFPMLDL